jgi:hypothetical protein
MATWLCAHLVELMITATPFVFEPCIFAAVEARLRAAAKDWIQVMARRPTPGDVLELAVPDGVIYLHYLGKHVEYGDGVVVCLRKQAKRAPVSPDLFREGYVTFYPVIAAVGRGFAAVVGHLPSPGLPERLRRRGAISGRKVETWIIEDGSKEVVKQELSDEERQLPIASIWNHEFLVQRVNEAWRPEMEGRNE